MRVGRTHKPVITAWCDGSCTKVGDGGWGVYIVYPGPPHAKRHLFGGEVNTTISRMELTAAIRATLLMPTPERSVICSDSRYAVDGITDQIHMWLRTGWRTSSNNPLKNLDLWQELYKLSTARPLLEYRWVKGHSGNAGNDVADALALRGRLSLDCQLRCS